MVACSRNGDAGTGGGTLRWYLHDIVVRTAGQTVLVPDAVDHNDFGFRNVTNAGFYQGLGRIS